MIHKLNWQKRIDNSRVVWCSCGSSRTFSSLELDARGTIIVDEWIEKHKCQHLNARIDRPNHGWRCEDCEVLFVPALRQEAHA